MTHSPDGADVIFGDNLDVGGGEDPEDSVPLSLVPVGVDLPLHIDQVALLEAELTRVLGLKRNGEKKAIIKLNHFFWKFRGGFLRHRGTRD